MLQIAFLRGLNVGTGHRVTMDRLRQLFEAAGCTGVATFQAAGNVAFDGPGPGAPAIEAALAEGLGYAVPTYLRTAAELAAVAGADPFPGPEPAKPASRQVTFLREKVPAATKRAVEAASNDVDVLRVQGRELHWRAGAGVADSTLDWKALVKVLGDPGTTRNVTTVRKLAAKFPPG